MFLFKIKKKKGFSIQKKINKDIDHRHIKMNGHFIFNLAYWK